MCPAITFFCVCVVPPVMRQHAHVAQHALQRQRAEVAVAAEHLLAVARSRFCAISVAKTFAIERQTAGPACRRRSAASAL
jgi:hypothetical protein